MGAILPYGISASATSSIVMFKWFFEVIFQKTGKVSVKGTEAQKDPTLITDIITADDTPPSINAIAAPHLSPKQIEAFQRDGVICLRNVISEGEINALRADIDQQVAQDPPSGSALDLEEIRKEIWGETKEGRALTAEEFVQKAAQKNNGEVQELQAYFEPQHAQHNTHLAQKAHGDATQVLKKILDANPYSSPNIDKISAEPVGCFYIDIQQWRRFSNIEKIALNSALPAICATLLDTETLHFWGDSTRIKTPNTAQRTTLHQDWAYFPFKGVQSCSVWIALDHSTRANGAPYYIKKSHKWGKVFASNVIINATQNPLSLYETLPDIDDHTDHPDQVTFDVQPGDIIIHHVLTLHGAPGNTSLKNNRRAMTLRYCGDDIRLFNKPGALDIYEHTPMQKDGAPLNPEVFPQVWPIVSAKCID